MPVNIYSPTSPLAVGSAVYLNDFLTTKAPDGIYSDGTDAYTVAGGVITAIAPCPVTPPVLITIDSVTDQSVVGTNDGCVNTTGSSGVPPYTYSIDGGVTYVSGNNFCSLAPGTYTVIVKDSIGQIDSKQGIVKPAVGIQIFSITNETVAGANDGCVNSLAVSGTSPFEYSKDGGATWQTSGNFCGLAAGNYTITVRDANGKTASTLGTVTAGAATLTPSIASITHEGLANANDGALTVTQTGGVGPYQYSIDNGATYQSSATFTNLPDGAYTITVKDSTGATATTTGTVLPGLAAALLSKTDETNSTLNDGTITLQAIGGIGPYEYSLDGVTWQTSPTFTGLGAGTYTGYVRDSRGSIIASTPTTIQINELIATLVSRTHTGVAENDGSITVTQTGGTGPYTYSIDGGVTFQSSPTFSNLVPGIYNIIVKDSLGLTGTVNNVEVASPFITSWQVSAGQTITLPVTMSCGVEINWGDGNITTETSANPTHTYAAAGTYDVTVYVTACASNFRLADAPASKDSLVDIKHFGKMPFSGGYNFGVSSSINGWDPSQGGAINLGTVTADDYPRGYSTPVTDYSNFFRGARNMPSITNISSWNMAAATNTSYMFSHAHKFNQDLSSWDVSNVTTMNHMFEWAESFNSSVLNWDTSSVTNMTSMFFAAFVFNQPVNHFNTSNVTSTASMFNAAFKFNQPVDAFNLANVTSMQYMFNQAWEFNQAVNTWNTSAVTNMAGMFYDAFAFNQPVNNWNVSNVTNMAQMFQQAKAFQQSLASWNVSNVTAMDYGANDTGFMHQKYGGNLYSVANIDALLTAWSALPVQSGVRLNLGTVETTNAPQAYYSCSNQAAFDALVAKGWTIVVAGCV